MLPEHPFNFHFEPLFIRKIRFVLLIGNSNGYDIRSAAIMVGLENANKSVSHHRLPLCSTPADHEEATTLGVAVCAAIISFPDVFVFHNN